jgi:hypothetical protein
MAEGDRMMSWLTVDATNEETAMTLARTVTRQAAIDAGFPRVDIMAGGVDPA